jgi:hypothetical protein
VRLPKFANIIAYHEEEQDPSYEATSSKVKQFVDAAKKTVKDHEHNQKGGKGDRSEVTQCCVQEKV